MQFITVPAQDRDQFPPNRHLTVAGIRYFFDHQIGRGAHSRVYQAKDEWGNSLVVKVYDEKNAARWQYEAKVLRYLASPWVVHLYEAFEFENFAYLIMQNMGVSLGRCQFDGEPLRASQLIARELLAGIHHIHQRGYAHTDINPQNIMLRIQAENQKIQSVGYVDFAYATHKDKLHLQHPMAMWIPPPEYYDQKLGPRSLLSDIYQIALVILEVALAKKLAYSKEDCLADLPAQEARESDVPWIRGLALALSKHPKDRPNAPQLWQALKPLIC